MAYRRIQISQLVNWATWENPWQYITRVFRAKASHRFDLCGPCKHEPLVYSQMLFSDLFVQTRSHDDCMVNIFRIFAAINLPDRRDTITCPWAFVLFLHSTVIALIFPLSYFLSKMFQTFRNAFLRLFCN